jgi:hypothetical protein
MTDMELLSHRLQTLENRFRTMKLLAIIACIVVAALLLMGQAPSPFPRNTPAFRAYDQLPEKTQARLTVEQDELRARQIILVDDKGKERASLVTDNAGSVFLMMADKAGKARINLSVSNDGPNLTFLDPSGQARTILGSTTVVPSHVNDNGIAEVAPPSSIVLFDSKGKLLFRTP